MHDTHIRYSATEGRPHAYRYHDGRTFCPLCASNPIGRTGMWVVGEEFTPIPDDELINRADKARHPVQCDGCDREI